MPTLTATLQQLEQDCRNGLHLGGQLCVWHGGSEVADVAFGEVQPGEAMSPEHPMLWLSSGKPVTAVAVARLWEAGELKLDDPVKRFIPEFGTKGKEAITIRHLLTHTAGMRAIDLGWPGRSWDDVLARLCDKKVEPRWIPGLRAGYHRMSSWFVLGEILQRVSGTDISTHLRREIFEPLGMTDCWVGVPTTANGEPDIAVAPIFDTSAPELTEHPWTQGRFLTQPSPGANAVGPVRQLCRFYRMLLGNGTLDDVALLEPPTVEAMTARQRVGLFDSTFRRPLDWGLGFILDSRHYGDEAAVYGYGSHCSTRVFGHGGYRSSTGFADPEYDLAVALVVNGTPGEAAHQQRFHRLICAVYEDLELGSASARRRPE